MKIVLSKHILRDKLPILEQHGFKIRKTDIEKVIQSPDHLDKESDKPKIIASKDFDSEHILRVVYKVHSGIIKAITLYPAQKGRYY